MVGWLVHACNGNDCNYRTLPLTLSVVLLLLLFTHLEWFKLLPMINQNSALILRFLFPRCVCVWMGPEKSVPGRTELVLQSTTRCLLGINLKAVEPCDACWHMVSIINSYSVRTKDGWNGWSQDAPNGTVVTYSDYLTDYSLVFWPTNQPVNKQTDRSGPFVPDWIRHTIGREITGSVCVCPKH